ncbi:MAG: rhodanese-like domain-containing protein [Gammaproteobacteria bacterium]|nr:rhodanese-like domain-containing protein [Gammaproteobacteria bacterium]MDH5776728.1 rhodanese-like domain-containing protein [Gammaproteobacteria bacterium]
MTRSIKPEEFINLKDNTAALLDIRRDDDYKSSNEIVPGAVWYDPTKIDEWMDAVPKEGQVVIYCVRGGGVSNSVVDRLQADGINAQFIEGGIEGLKDAGGEVVQK